METPVPAALPGPGVAPGGGTGSSAGVLGRDSGHPSKDLDLLRCLREGPGPPPVSPRGTGSSSLGGTVAILARTWTSSGVPSGQRPPPVSPGGTRTSSNVPPRDRDLLRCPHPRDVCLQASQDQAPRAGMGRKQLPNPPRRGHVLGVPSRDGLGGEELRGSSSPAKSQENFDKMGVLYKKHQWEEATSGDFPAVWSWL